jgi:hypothetical protein
LNSSFGQVEDYRWSSILVSAAKSVLLLEAGKSELPDQSVAMPPMTFLRRWTGAGPDAGCNRPRELREVVR